MTGSYSSLTFKGFGTYRKVFSRGLIAFLLPFCLTGTGAAQNIVEKLDRAFRSTINAYALNASKLPMDTARGFFISADGLAITTASVFHSGDTVLFTDEKDRPLELNRIIAFHSYSNLALVQLKNPRMKEIDFLLPSKKTFGSKGEILAFAHEKEAEGGLGYGSIEKIHRLTFLGRCASITMQAGAASEGSPIMNEMGDHIGVYHFNGSKKTGLLIPVSVINDDNWVSVNQTWSNFKKNQQRGRLTTPFYCEALVSFGLGKWLDAARSYTALLKISPNDAQVHALRSLTRYKYGNNVGAREDFTYSVKIDPGGYLPYYSRAQFHLAAKDRVNALEDLFLAIDKNPNFADAFLEIGRIQTFMGDIKMAFASLTFALETDSLLAEAWYERGRLYIQHSTNMDKALSDLTTGARLDPSLQGVFTLIGNIKLNRQDYLEAIQEFDNAINQDGRDTHALMNRGMAYFNTGLKEKACADWDQAGKQGNLQAFKLISRHCADIRKGSIQKVAR
jgi:tetratricopeptide (TPR) repeat protein